MATGKRYRILIADDHPLIAEGITRILEREFDVVGVVSDGQQLLASAATLKPDIICLDIAMPSMDGIRAAVELHKSAPRTKLIFVTQQLEVPYLRAAFRAGASGYVAKQTAATELLSAIQEALAGRQFVTSLLVNAAHTIQNELRADPSEVYTHTLTPRQRDVLQLLSEGMTAKEIGAALHISTKTAEFHKQALMNALGLYTTAELTRYALTKALSPAAENNTTFR